MLGYYKTALYTVLVCATFGEKLYFQFDNIFCRIPRSPSWH